MRRTTTLKFESRNEQVGIEDWVCVQRDSSHLSRPLKKGGTRFKSISIFRGASLFLCAAPPFLIQAELSKGIKSQHVNGLTLNPEP